jgi:hypothetical protein
MKDWPSISEQKAYWDKKDQDIVLATLQSLTNAVETLTASVEGLLAICKDQQIQINNLNQKTNPTCQSVSL